MLNDNLLDGGLVGWFRRRVGGPSSVQPPVSQAQCQTGSVAVVTLSSRYLTVWAAGLPEVALADRLGKADRQVEKLVRRVTANPAIRFVVLCGMEPPIDRPGQALLNLLTEGASLSRWPGLRKLDQTRLARFRQPVELLDLRNETDPTVIKAAVKRLVARDAG